MADYFTGYQNALPQTSLADMMNLASSAQQYKQAQALNPLELQAKQMALEQLGKMNPELLTKAQQEARLATTQADVAYATSPATIIKAQSEADRAAAESRSAQLKTMTDFAQRGTNIAYQLLGDKDLTRQKVVDAITNHMEKLPWIKPRDIDVAISQIPNVDGEALKPHLIDYIRSNNDGLINALNSKYAPSSLVSAGNQILPVATANQALTDVAPGTSTGPGIKIGLPPTQQFVDEKGAKFILGANGQRQYTEVGAATSAAQQALGTASGTDFASTVADANAATITRSIYDKIRSALPLAFTGVGSDKKQFLSKLAQAIGIPANTLETTNTEELVKNSKLLQVVGGNTDAARAIAELANPSASMTLAGNQKVIEQLDGQEKFKEKKADFLEPVAGDPAAYQQRLRQWNSAADPLFFTQMNQEDAAQIMRNMSPARKAELLQKRERAKALGIIQ
jgi:hypothetical protein